MSGLLEHVESIIIRADDDGLYVLGKFPKVTEVTRTLLNAADPRWIEVRGNVVHFWMLNGHAVYRIAEAREELDTLILVREG